MSPAVTAFWSVFLAGVVSLTIVVVAFAAALVVAQRRRLTLQQDYSQRVLRAHEEERAWVARELHDDMLQRVALIRHELDALWATLSTGATAQQAQRLRALTAELTDLGEALRNVAHRLHPTIVDQIGLPRSLEALAVELGRAGLDVSVATGDAGHPIPISVAHTAYRIAQEALRNVAKHSGARAAEMSLATTRTTLVLRVSDHGKGLEPGANARGLGLSSMVERAELAKGSLTITSREGEGTTIEANLPLEAA
ncbi:MAG: sensor histidine kinase [Gemmatimonadales bacterium]